MLLPSEIDFALGFVLRGYLMNFGIKWKKDRHLLEMKIKMSVCTSLLYFFGSLFLKPSKQQLERRRELWAEKMGLQKPQIGQFFLYRLYSPNKSTCVCVLENK